MSKDDFPPGEPGNHSDQPGLDWTIEVPDAVEAQATASAAFEALKQRVIDADPKTLTAAEKFARNEARRERTARGKASKAPATPKKPGRKPATKAADTPAATPPAEDKGDDIPTMTPAALEFLRNPGATAADALTLDPASQKFVQYHYTSAKRSEAQSAHRMAWLYANAPEPNPAYSKFVEALRTTQNTRHAAELERVSAAASAAPTVQRAQAPEPPQDDIKHLRTVIADAHVFLSAPVDDITPEQAADLAADHVFAIGAIKGDHARGLALNAAAELANSQPRYETEFARQAPALLAEAKAANASSDIAVGAGPAQAPDPAGDLDRARRVISTTHSFLDSPRDDIPLERAAELAASDLANVQAIQDAKARALALNAVVESGQVQPRYKAEITRQAPGMAVELAAVEKQFDADSSKVFAIGQGLAYIAEVDEPLSPEEAASTAKEDIEAIRSIKGSELREQALSASFQIGGLQPLYKDEFARQAPDLVEPARSAYAAEQAAYQAERAAATAAQPKPSPAPAQPESENSIEPGVTPAQAIPAPPASAQQQATPAPAPATPAPPSTLFARFMSKVAGVAQSAADRALSKAQARAAATPAPAPVDLAKPPLPAARVTPQSRAVPAALAARFVQVDEAFYFKDDKTKAAPAFVDHGGKLATRGSHPEVVEALVAIAHERGWSSITVKGSDVFRQATWLKGARSGLQVNGYEPTEQDKALLAKQDPANVVAPVATPERVAAPPPAAEPPAAKAAEPPAVAAPPAPAAPAPAVAPAAQETKPQQPPAARKPLDPANVTKAMEFLNNKPAFMLRKYPDDRQLAAAYTLVRWAELVAEETQPGNKVHQDTAVAIAKRYAAESIKHGETPWCPDIKVKQQAKQTEVAVGKPSNEPVLER